MAKITKVTLPIADVLKEYTALREQEKVVKSRKDYLASLIKDYAGNHGAKDSNGSYYCETDELIYGATAVKKVSLDQEKAIKFLKRYDNDTVNKCVKTKEYVDEKAVEDCISSGLLTVEEVQDLSVTKVTYSTLVKAKEVIEDVEEYSLQKASKVKRKK